MADVILGIGGFVLAVALLPSFRKGSRPAVWTSLVCAEVMLAFSAAYAIEQDLLAMCSAIVNFCLWATLGVLKRDEKS